MRSFCATVYKQVMGTQFSTWYVNKHQCFLTSVTIVSGTHLSGQYLHKHTIPVSWQFSTSDKHTVNIPGVAMWLQTRCKAQIVVLPTSQNSKLTWLSPNSSMCFCMPSSCFFNCEFWNKWHQVHRNSSKPTDTKINFIWLTTFGTPCVFSDHDQRIQGSVKHTATPRVLISP